MKLHRCVAAAAVLGAVLALASPFAHSASPNPRRTPVVDVVARVRAAVVNIHSERTVHGPASEELFAHTPSQNRINGMGTGIIVDPRGYIVTNHHVVEDVSVIRIRLSDGTNYSARILTRDPETDLALLKIEPGRPLPTMPLGTSTDLLVGETVIAIGNAYGYEHTVTVGVVSAVKRDVILNKEISYKQLIQTDASINPGNSGGPLLNINGELIGVNVAIRAGAQGIGFAIPVDSVLRVVADMLSTRRRNGTWHGLVCRDCVGDLDEEKTALGNDASGKEKTVSHRATPPPPAGSLARWVVVERVEQASPGARAGLKDGDVIVEAGDLHVACGLDLERAFLDRAAGDSVPVVVRRKGDEKRLALVLQPLESPAPPAADVVWRKLGLRLRVVAAEAVSRNNPQLHGGVAVTDLDPQGPAAKAGIQRGDILVGLHQWEAVSV
ncbi:MAG TPA: trypsin-like peptidase domain-containing protein, partial [Gemmataceae bacterium]|nr:trypsin-like peptidase domain-containing protein [Gemmataceae bacterium]